MSGSSNRVLHATALAYGPRGVLLMGPPGRGKSDLALRALAHGAVPSLGLPAPLLIADDAVLVRADAGRLWLTAPEPTYGKIEVRGVGIVDLPAASVAPPGKSIEATLLIELVTTSSSPTDSPVDRMPEPRWSDIQGVSLPTIALDASSPSGPLKLGLAVAFFGRDASR